MLLGATSEKTVARARSGRCQGDTGLTCPSCQCTITLTETLRRSSQGDPRCTVRSTERTLGSRVGYLDPSVRSGRSLRLSTRTLQRAARR